MHRVSPSASVPRPTNVVRAAFTLVELLVVIGIIALLIGILIPALSAARSASQSVACMARLREVGNAMLMYATQNRQVLAYQVVEADRLGVGTQRTSFGSARWVRTSLSAATRDGALLERYLGPKALEKAADCPELVSQIGESAYAPSYGGAYFITTADNDGNSYLKLNQIEVSAETIMLADTALLTSDGISRSFWTNSPYEFEPPSYTLPRFHGRHRGKGSVLWFDGHVTSETPGYLPSTTGGLTGGGIGATVSTADIYKRVHLGHITRGGEPFTSPTIDYYYYVSKTERRLRVNRFRSQ